jgi:hypothetical protein
MNPDSEFKLEPLRIFDLPCRSLAQRVSIAALSGRKSARLGERLSGVVASRLC